ncbi:MAG: hypothetical protein HXY25_01080 [Alphaproteobacteria bacterium]|nr:hypothetical protein [Alphaproteobacteria bacterium]
MASQSPPPDTSAPEQKHWLVRPSTIRLLWIGGIALLVGVTGAELTLDDPHTYFGADGLFGFNAWYGFLTCAAMVVGAKLLGYAIKRPDDYYGPDGEETR